MNTERHEQIDNYLLDKLSNRERVAFEITMHNDPQFRYEVELRRHIINAFQRKCEQQLLEKRIDTQSRKIRKFRILSIACGVAAVIALLLHLGFSPKYSSEQLFTGYFHLEELQIAPSRGANTQEDQQNETLYRQTINGMEADDNPTTTIQNLVRLSSLPGFEYREEALFALALAYLRNNQRGEARKTLLQLTETPSQYTNKAKELSEKLKATKWFD
ncbi:MAG: hypothetical protein LBC40_04240 [Dysgonamonadaceae bacterium]|jgi:hypothetical protein|nr:hypothetical protein [Dysgonamonadaceae bacterium]